MKSLHEIFDGLKADNLEFDEDMLFDKEATDAFVKRVLMRNDKEGEIKLSSLSLDTSRKSVREFNLDEEVKINDFGNFLNVLRYEKSDNNVKCTFPSAGGLYPIDVFIYVKENRVNGIKAGIYKYLPNSHSLEKISDRQISVTAHYYGNRNIFFTSAFSMFFMYNPKASYPKYAGMGLFYGILDCGIILQQLSISACDNNMGSCIIGDLDYEKIRDVFEIDNDMVYLCCMEFGYPKKGMEINEKQMDF